MPNISSLERTFEVAAARAELADPAVWDRYRWRTDHPQSPHREVSDIWMRYNAIEHLGPRFNEEHTAVWYPIAEQLPYTKRLAEEMFATVSGVQLGGVLVTKIPAGRQVYPHVDRGWHAGYYQKFAIQIAGHKDQAFCFENESLSALSGEAYEFRNDVPHWVVNPSPEDRITLIVCVRSH